MPTIYFVYSVKYHSQMRFPFTWQGTDTNENVIADIKAFWIQAKKNLEKKNLYHVQKKSFTYMSRTRGIDKTIHLQKGNKEKSICRTEL